MSKLRLVVLGMFGRLPFGGQTWLYLNWLRAFQRLGHEVWYVEDDTVWPYDPVRNTITDDCSYAVSHITRCLERVGLAGRWAFCFGGQTGRCWGLSRNALNELYRTCDIMFTFGATTLREEHLAAPFRVYIECDPVTSQLRLAQGDQHTRQEFERHQRLFTYGENYGASDCLVPLDGFRYGRTRQPVDLDLWPYHYDADAPYFTTIGNYRQAGNDVMFNGEVYRWSKHHEWEKFISLPSRTAQPLELAVVLEDEADRQRLTAHGWRVRTPFEMSLDVFGTYPEYIRGSRAEFTVAKDQNVRLRSGWFSERDVCYLASGKPVVAQDTGFTNILPTGDGLFGFTRIEEALAAIDAINSDYERHCKSARAIAEEYFEAGKVAKRLLENVGVE